MHSSIEPTLITDPALATVLAELQAREPIFHRPELGTTRADFAQMMADDFWEIGASGQLYSREYVLDTLEARHQTPHADAWQTMDFHCQQLANDLFLLTYTLLQDAHKTRRSTLWQRRAGQWTIRFHQGTLVQEA